jgi:aryl-alcohol dehydrogenase-like predicted oxidoreductase/histidinol phosphatase-like enzyme
MLGLGCMRLSTRRDRDDDQSVGVIRAALEAGITLLDSAHSYGSGDGDSGHNERLVARAIAEWGGDRASITVATKGGMRRPGGEWIPDGRAKHLRESCEASRRALGQETIDLYQLHVVDPRTPLATSVRALAKLRDDGWIRDVGLCNVTVSQTREAQAIVPIASVQVSLGPLDDENLRNGVAEYCRDSGIRLIAYRPLGGERRKVLARDIALRAIADRHDATPEEVVLAWLLTFGDGVVPLPGATKVETVASIGRSLRIRLTADDRAALDAKFSGRLLRVPRAKRRPDPSDGDVVIVMGMPGAGKTTLGRQLETEGYERINRDEMGGTLSDLIPRLGEVLSEGKRRVVLDNTYPTRASRNEVIETAWSLGAHVRCVWLNTDVGQAQINSILRMLEVHGSLPTPEEIKLRSKKDTRYLLPDAQFRYERTLEPPTSDEGFEAVEALTPTLRVDFGDKRALILDLDDLADDGARSRVAQYKRDGWVVFVHCWRPQVARGEMTAAAVEVEFSNLLQTLGGDVDWAWCPHDAGPPVCWCRKPIPGQLIAFATRRGVSLRQSIVVGTSAAARTMAERVEATFETWISRTTA